MKRRIGLGSMAAIIALTSLWSYAAGWGDVEPQLDAPAPPATSTPPTAIRTEAGQSLAVKATATGTTADIPAVLRLRDPVTLGLLREQRIVVPNVDLAPYGDVKLSANGYLAAAIEGATNAIVLSPISLTDPIIESVSVETAEDGTLLAVPVQVNVRTVTVHYETRVRLFLEGLDYTALDPARDSLSDILADVEAKILLRYR